MTHAFYVALSYAASGIVVAVLVGWTLLDGRAQQRALKELEAAGIRRRSAARDQAEKKA
ncbi:heme exporter protein CcmD [Gellertiella hungarica]|uniref:Heme exporter protein D n=1 Tax=Gellertiella hungarica TaxID=1572859 RepID=A0A7W6J7F2_9HYPH|nr:heme exporter protein CcmD [Gellertiella hungarica]MBB4065271.1 heme exporter protein D [Gellertiella hungarica]